MEEKEERYKILLYSENPRAINVLKRKFEKENIDLVVKNLQYKRILSTTTRNTGDKNYLMVIYDLTSKTVDCQKTLIQTRNLAQNLVFIFKLKGVQEQNVYGCENKTIFVDDLSRLTTEKVANYLIKHLMDKQNRVVVFTNEKESKSVYGIKRAVFLLLLVLIFMPYFLIALVSANNILLNKVLFDKADVALGDKILTIYTKELGVINGVVSFYKTIPFFGLFYTRTSQLSSKYFSQNLYMQKMFDKMSLNNCYMKEFFLNNSFVENCGSKRLVATTASMGSVGDGSFLKTEDLFKEIENILNTTQRTFGAGAQKYIAVVVQEGGGLTPTGTSPQKIYIYEITEGKYKTAVSFTQEYLKDKFRGDVAGVSKLNNHDIFEGSLDINDKYKVYLKAINEVFEINISGIVFFENKNKNDLSDIKDVVLQKRLSVKDSIVLYEKSLELLKNSAIFYLPNGNAPVTNESVFSEYTHDGTCTDSSMSFIETTGNLDDFKNGGVSIKGEYFDEKFSLAIYYKNKHLNKSDSFIIKSSENISFTAEGDDSLIQEVYYENKFEYLISKSKSGSIDGLLARYYLLPSGCDKGFMFRVDKQIGNEKLTLNYEIRTQRQSYLYIDRSLTGRGNKFYNDGLLYLNKGFLFKFVN